MANYKIEKSYSPHRMGRSGYRPIMIVNHIVEGSFNSCLNWFRNPSSEVSSNYVTSKDGRLAEVIPIKEAAWCNGTSTSPSSNTYYGKALNTIVKAKKTNANYYTVSIEHEGVLRQTGGALTEEQYQATLWLHKYIINEVKRIYGYLIPIDRNHITGHKWINPITKPFCPGGKFPFDRLIRDLTLWNYGELKRESCTPILGKATANISQMKEYASKKGAEKYWIDLAEVAYKKSVAYGVDPAVLWAQSCKETNFGKFTGVLTKDFKNPCGMKNRGGGGNYDPRAHHVFKSWEDGFSAQAQHLALYAGSRSYPWKVNFDPRNFASIKGTAPYVEDLGGKWAPSPNYGIDIVKRMKDLKAIKVDAKIEEKDPIEKAEEKKGPKKEFAFDFGIAYPSKIDQEPAQDLAKWLRDKGYRVLAFDTEDMTSYDVETIIQVGSSSKTVKDRSILISGKDRQDTSLNVSKWKLDNDKDL